jgi:hypothetical protein
LQRLNPTGTSSRRRLTAHFEQAKDVHIRALFAADPGPFATRTLVFTIPFVLYGIFRYLYLVHHKQVGGNPTTAVLSDVPLLLNALL